MLVIVPIWHNPASSWRMYVSKSITHSFPFHLLDCSAAHTALYLSGPNSLAVQKNPMIKCYWGETDDGCVYSWDWALHQPPKRDVWKILYSYNLQKLSFLPDSCLLTFMIKCSLLRGSMCQHSWLTVEILFVKELKLGWQAEKSKPN